MGNYHLNDCHMNDYNLNEYHLNDYVLLEEMAVKEEKLMRYISGRRMALQRGVLTEMIGLDDSFTRCMGS